MIVPAVVVTTVVVGGRVAVTVGVVVVGCVTVVGLVVSTFIDKIGEIVTSSKSNFLFSIHLHREIPEMLKIALKIVRYYNYWLLQKKDKILDKI